MAEQDKQKMLENVQKKNTTKVAFKLGQVLE
jgi:hypothetical protein